MTNWTTWALAASSFSLMACQGEPPKAGASTPTKGHAPIEEKLAQYTTVRLNTDLSKLTENERRMLPILIDAAASTFLGAFTRDSASGRYRVDFPKMRAAVDEMAGQILRFQGNGDYAGVTRFMAERGKLPTQLQEDLAKLGSKGIPVDIVFDQGPGVLQ